MTGLPGSRGLRRDGGERRPPAGFFPQALAAAAFLAAFQPAGAARGWISSEWVGGWPGVCEDSACVDDGTPVNEPPPHIRRNILEHQLESPVCPSDLVFISVEFPENTGSPELDAKLSAAAGARFRKASERALKLSCNDLIYGCGGLCLPAGIESRYYLHQSAPWTLSAFRVDRFIGNFRLGRHERGTVEYFFENWSLSAARELETGEIFPDPARSARLLWAEADRALKARGACPPGRYRVSGKRPAGRDIRPGDLILSRRGATLALYAGRDGKCVPQALDLPKEAMAALGASPALWAWPEADGGIPEAPGPQYP